jgi:uncharacterized protein YkwD
MAGTRRLRVVLAAVVMLMGLATATGNLWVIEHQSLAHQVDSMRQYNGLAPIPEDPALTDLATEHSWQMARAQRVFHSSDATLASTPGPWQTVGQNVGSGTQVWRVVRAFMDSPTHRDLILGDWTSMGYGHVRAGDGNVYVTLWFRR